LLFFSGLLRRLTTITAVGQILTRIAFKANQQTVEIEKT